MSVDLHEGDCLTILRTMPANSVDSVVTDPPYGLAFMGRRWDYNVPSVEIWQEALRVLKPGGHLLSFGGTRTYHRMVVAIEDAGFEIRDQIGWLYGTGFPKSLDVAKAIDKHLGQRGTFGAMKPGRARWINKDGTFWGVESEGWQRPWKNDPDAVDNNARVYQPASTEGQLWQGWGTALKPAWEPLVLARKPFTGTVVANVLAHGTGVINVDACRVPHAGKPGNWGEGQSTGSCWGPGRTTGAKEPEGRWSELGRWPANMIHDDSAEVLEAFAAYGQRKASGTAARFFYSAKASQAERAGSNHPTVKPVALMRYLCRLVTPPGGTVLDPFAGSGTTGQAAADEGFDAILIEREPEYCQDIRQRLAAAGLQAEG